MKLFMLLLICTALGHASPDTYILVTLPRITGMFSVFSYVTGVLYLYEHASYAGLEVDFMNLGLYYDPDHGSNWWNYYCEPIRLGSKENAVIKLFDRDEYVDHAMFVERRLNRHQVNELIGKYIKINQNIQEKIDSFALENFTGFHIIAVHYRGTDKVKEAPIVPHNNVLEAINNYINTNSITNYKIFLATDELEFAQLLQIAYPGSVIMHSTQYSTDKRPLHFYSSNKYLQGEEALIDCILLSKGDVLIRTSSNLSLWSTYFNPTIPQIELNKRIIKRKKR